VNSRAFGALAETVMTLVFTSQYHSQQTKAAVIHDLPTPRGHASRRQYERCLTGVSGLRGSSMVGGLSDLPIGLL
jgi:hypothetical protein